MYLDEEIFCYIGRRVDNDNILPSMDDIYTEFQDAFEIHGCNEDIIEEMIDAYVSSSDITGVQIDWEGRLNVICDSGITEVVNVPSKTA